jgi:small nuclear ribonucleoprotein F
LKTLVGKQVVVRLKWNRTEYKGKLVSFDSYMNVQLENTFEVIREDPETKQESIGEIFIRCNNVLFIREDVECEADEPEKVSEKNAEDKMETEDASTES